MPAARKNRKKTFEMTGYERPQIGRWTAKSMIEVIQPPACYQQQKENIEQKASQIDIEERKLRGTVKAEEERQSQVKKRASQQEQPQPSIVPLRPLTPFFDSLKDDPVAARKCDDHDQRC